MDTFQALWQKFHPDAVPVGHTLARNGTWNLTRFHLLPNGREAALSRSEFRGLFDRFNILATETLGENQPIWIIVPDRTAPEWTPSTPVDHAERARLRRLRSRYRLSPRWEYYSADDKCVYRIEAAEAVWRPHGLDHLLMMNYYEHVPDMVLMNATTGAIFAPYVAGAYVSQPTPNELIALLSQYYGWLPMAGEGILRFNPAQMAKGSFQVSKACAAAIQKSLGN